MIWVAKFVLGFSKGYQWPKQNCVGTLAIALIVMALDYLIPIWGTKAFGGTKARLLNMKIQEPGQQKPLKKLNCWAKL